MGKASRRTSVAILAAVASFALAGTALASSADPMKDDPDYVGHQWTIDNNLDNLFRVAGPDRISTSIKLMESTSKWRFCGWRDADLTAEQLNQKNENCQWVIVARADAFPDALASGPLADVYNAPILLTNTGTIDSRVLDAIDKHGFKNAILVGGTGIFPESARAQLDAIVGNVERVRGVDRFETATAIAKKVAKKMYDESLTKRTVNVYLATGLNFPDALAAGAAAADNDGVVLLTHDYTMEHFTYDFLVRQRDWIDDFTNGIEIHTVGGQAEAAAKSRIEDIADTNSGRDRYQTAVMLAKKFSHDIEKIAVVSGETFGDAISAGGWVANHDGALLLTNNAYLNGYTKAFLKTVADTDVDVVVVGGPGAVSRNVSYQLAHELYMW